MHKASALRLCVPSAPTKASHVLPQLDFAASIGQRCLIGHVRATTYCGHVATTDAEATEVLQQPALAKFSCHDLRNRPVVADDVAVLDISSPHNCNSTSAGGSDRCSTARLGPASHGTQQRLQQQQHDNTAPQEEYQKSLCRMLRSEHCLSLHQLAEVITEHGCYMDGQSLAASFTAAARVCRLSVRDEQQCDSRNTQPSVPCTQQQVLQVLEQHLVPVMLGKLRHMDAMGLQMVLYSLATLQCKQEPVIMQLEAAITPVVHQLQPGRTCQLLWSLAKLRLKPHALLMTNITRHISSCIHVLSSQDMCQLLEGIVQLQLQPTQQFLDACCRRVLELCAELEPRASSSLLHSLARLVTMRQQKPRKLRQQQQQEQQQEQQQSQRADEATAGLVLPPVVLQQLLHVTHQALVGAVTVPMQQSPQTVTQQQQQQQPHTRMGLVAQDLPEQWLKPPSVGVTGMRLVQQQHHPIMHTSLLPPFQDDDLARQGLSARTSTARHAVSQYAQLSVQHQYTKCPQQQLQQHHQQQQQQQCALQQQAYDAHCEPCLTAAGLARLAHALQLLKTDPPREWQAAYTAAAQKLMCVPDARSVPLLLAPLVRWRQLPGQAWLQQYVTVCEGLLWDMEPQGLAVLGHSLVAARAPVSSAWLSMYLSAAYNTRLAASPAGCSCLLHTLGSWRVAGELQHPKSATSASEGAAGHSSVARATAGAAGSSSVARAAASAAGERVVGVEGVPGCELDVLASKLVAQCIRCFLDQGECFTSEQLGMFCKGLTLWGRRGSQQLADKLQQVVLQHLNRRSGRRGFNPRFTSATLCNILLALAVSCPSAATPALLTRLWRVWHSRVLPVTDATQAAAVAWAVKWLGVQPPAFFVSGLLQQLQVTAADSQLQHIAAVLLQARQGNWLVDDQQVQQLLQTVLHKHSTELLVAQGHVRHQRQQCQHVFLESAVYQQAMWQQQCTGNSCVVGSSDTVSLQRRESAGGASSSDRQSGSCGAELATIHALNTPEHKGWLTAAAALQAWHEILERPQLQHAVELCAASARLLPHEHQQLAQLHTQTLSAVMYQNQQNQETMINRKQRTQGAAEAMAILKQQNRVLRESSAVVSSVVA